MGETDTVTVREWDADVFQRRVVELEAHGYSACLESYHVLAEMSPETGEAIHLRSIEMCRISQTTGSVNCTSPQEQPELG